MLGQPVCTEEASQACPERPSFLIRCVSPGVEVMRKVCGDKDPNYLLSAHRRLDFSEFLLTSVSGNPRPAILLSAEGRRIDPPSSATVSLPG